MPDDLFAPLGEGQVPPMASAATVRARGDQRRRRSKAALTGTGALVVALAVTGGLALAGGERQVVQPGAPVPSSTAPSSSAPSTPAPSGEATPTAEPAPTAPAYELADAALTPEDLARVEPGRWDYLDVMIDDGLLLDPCPGGTAYPRDVDRVARSSIGLLLLREAGGTDVVQQLARYSSVAAASDAFDGYRRAVEGCPVKPVEGLPEQVWRYEVLTSTDEVGVRTVLVQAKTGCEQDCGGTGPFYLGFAYYAVQHRDDAVVLTRVAVGEDGDPGLDYARPFFAAAQDRLRDAVG